MIRYGRNKKRVVKTTTSLIGELIGFGKDQLHKRTYNRPHPHRRDIIYIDPNEVDFLVSPNFFRNLGISAYGSHVIEGEWDTTYTDKTLHFFGGHEEVGSKKKLYKFDNYTFYRSAQQRFLEGEVWENTEFYDWLVETRENRSTGPKTIDEINDTLASFEELYMAIKQNGYFTQRILRNLDCGPGNKRYYVIPEQHEITINIGRSGELIFDEGRHRIVIAKILKIDKLPARVLVRHEQWQEKREICHAEGVMGLGDDQLFGHPDLPDNGAKG